MNFITHWLIKFKIYLFIHFISDSPLIYSFIWWMWVIFINFMNLYFWSVSLMRLQIYQFINSWISECLNSPSSCLFLKFIHQFYITAAIPMNDYTSLNSAYSLIPLIFGSLIRQWIYTYEFVDSETSDSSCIECSLCVPCCRSCYALLRFPAPCRACGGVSVAVP